MDDDCRAAGPLARAPLLTDGVITLTPPNAGDMENIVKWCNDPGTTRWMRALPAPYGVSDAEYFLEQVVASGWESGAELTWAIRAGGGDVPASGTIAIRTHQPGFRDGEIGFVVGPWGRGRGLATRAARLVVGYALSSVGLGLPVATWECQPGNLASWRVARNCGFRFDGVFPPDDAEHTPGSWHGTLHAGEALRARPEYLPTGWDDVEFGPAGAADLPEIAQLYRNAIGAPGCTWSEAYPNSETLALDFSDGALFRARFRGELVGAVSIGPPGDLLDVPWPSLPPQPAGLYRLAVSPPFQGLGFAKHLIDAALDVARERGAGGVILLVSPDNHAAIGLYHAAGFRPCGEVFAWDHHWAQQQLTF